MLTRPVPGDRVTWNDYLEFHPGDRKLFGDDPRPEVEGVVLETNDPGFWQGANAFAGRRATPEAIQGHLRVLEEGNLIQDNVLVQFDTGTTCFAPFADLIQIKDGKPQEKRRKPPGPRPRKTPRPAPRLADPGPWGGAVEV